MKQYRSTDGTTMSASTTETGVSEETTAAEETALPETTVPVETDPEPTADEVYCNVLTAAALLPGEVLTEDSFSLQPLSEVEYRQACATSDVFTESDIQRLLGLECAQYVPAGRYIGYDDVAKQFTAANPWGRSSDRQAILTIPAFCNAGDMASTMPGRYVDIQITVETKVEVPQETTAAASTDATTETVAETTPGVQHYTATVESTVVETYQIQAAAVVDILDGDRNSLYEVYAAWGSIPDVFRAEEMALQYTDLSEIARVTPCYISIAVPAEQAAVIDCLDAETMKVVISNPTPWVENELQSEAYGQIEDVCSILAALWNSQKKGSD